ncbi:hypothetical protein Back2_06510 [Nocardioides baekrokdamisoli]|uniref:Core-binding (CB) domain-containing protein n=1 Tax=Nocardioides baekrokdamisoli TaxID=1804624 RepID=A0A3G9IYU4_9ACTN|nr:hypothetical protein Back2_06510 [Nocardioides baekrokdamisoli]
MGDGEAFGLGSSTLRTNRHRVLALVRRAAAISPTEVTRRDIIDYLAAHPDWAPETRRGNRSALSAFFRWAFEEGRIEVNPATRLPRVRVPGGAPFPAPEPVIRDAINGARGRASDDPDRRARRSPPQRDRPVPHRLRDRVWAQN